MHSKKQVLIKVLLFNQAPTKVLAKYFNYSNVFLTEYVIKLPKNIELNEHTIQLEKSKQSLFEPIYSLGLIALETLKTYIKINLTNNFIWHSKSPIRASIFFDKKPNETLCLCINYWSFNNIIIKNQYLLLLIGKSLDQLDQARKFIQLNFTNAYYQIKICESGE